MQSLQLLPVAEGSWEVRDLPLRMPRAAGVIDPEPFRARARGDGPALAESFAASDGFCTLQLSKGPVPASPFANNGQQLTFVISGTLTFETANRCKVKLVPGDLVLTKGQTSSTAQLSAGHDCRLLQVQVGDDWPGERARPVVAADKSHRSDGLCNFKRMYRGGDDKSYFRPFDGLFGQTGQWNGPTPIIGLRFIDMAADTFIDWHPEIVNNLVIVMAGALELEVGGETGAVEVFHSGDICLAEDRTGHGHIDRMHGRVLVAVLIIADEHLSP